MTKAITLWRTLNALCKGLYVRLVGRDLLAMGTITRAEFGGNLRAAREAQKLEAAQVAAMLGMTVADVDLIETGRRPISTREFEHFVEIYGGKPSDYMQPTLAIHKPTKAVYRSVGAREDRADFDDHLSRCLAIYRQMADLKDMLGMPRASRVVYGRSAPASLKAAIAQGLHAAKTERERLGLGAKPIADVANLIAEQGVDVGSTMLPDDISGLMLAQDGEDAFIIVNERDHVLRRNFSLAHEYAHVLFDRDEAGIVSKHSEANTLRERRANAFAGAFIVPDAGVRDYLASVGKQRSRGLFGPCGTIDADDVVALAKRFGTSGQVIVYKLQRMKVVTEPSEIATLIKQTEGKVDLPQFDHTAARESGKRRLVELAELAYRRWEISEGKLREILRLVKSREDAERVARDIQKAASALETI